jgi:hypothetical protein
MHPSPIVIESETNYYWTRTKLDRTEHARPAETPVPEFLSLPGQWRESLLFPLDLYLHRRGAGKSWDWSGPRTFETVSRCSPPSAQGMTLHHVPSSFFASTTNESSPVFVVLVIHFGTSNQDFVKMHHASVPPAHANPFNISKLLLL